jgi:hypothetical protein
MDERHACVSFWPKGRSRLPPVSRRDVLSIESQASEAGIEQSNHSVVVFPLWRRTALVRRVAMNLAVLAETEEADDYRYEVAEQLFTELSGMGVLEIEQDELVGAFFHQVELALEVLFDDVSENAL